MRYTRGHTMTATANATSASTFTVPQERGDLRAFRLAADTADLAANTKVLITMAVNGIETYKDVPLADLNESLMLKRIENPISSEQGGIVSITATSTHGSDVLLAFSFEMLNF